jgi:integrase/recombinase XerD
VLSCLRKPRYRACLSTIYACGLRVSEGVALQVLDIDNSRMMIHVRNGKGGKARYVPLPESTLTILRSYWLTHRHPKWLFPATPENGQPLTTVAAPVSAGVMAQAFRAAVRASGIQKNATVHTLRHSYDPFAGSRGEPTPDSGLARAQLSEDHSDLRPSHQQNRRARRSRPPATDG